MAKNKMAKNKDKRLMAKAGIWEIISFIFTTIFAFIWFGVTLNALWFSLFLIVIKIIGMYWYLRIWKKTKWLK